MSAPSIKSGLNTATPMSFAKSRFGYLIGVNGIDRGIFWDGMASSAVELGIDAPAAGPSVASPGGGAATAGVYTCYYRYVDRREGVDFYSNLSPATTHTAADNDEFDYSSLTASSQTRVTHIQVFRSTSDQSDTVYLVGTVTDGTTTLSNDQNSDATLSALTGDSRLRVLQVNGEPNANRFSPPPNFKSVVVPHGDRMTYLVDYEYTVGTVATNGTTTVTGTGTAWTTEMEDRYIYIDGEAAPLLVDTVGSATSITLATAAATTASGKAYAIRPSVLERNRIYISEQDLPEAVIVTIDVQENVRDEDDLVGAYSLGSRYYAFKNHSIYRITWFNQPDIDAQPQPIAYRGSISNRTIDSHEGIIYAMDDEGAYMLAGERVQPISTPIHDIWRDGTLDFSKKKWWSVRVDPLEELVYFFVTYTGDSGTRPQRALVYDIRSGRWGLQSYVWEVGDAVKATVGSQRRMVVGTEDNTLYLANEDLLDGTAGSGTLRSTFTTVSSTTLTDTAGNFPTDCVGASIAVVTGTAKGQIRQIVTRSSSTEVIVDSAFSPQAVAGDTYLVGAIEWTMKTGLFGHLDEEQANPRYAALTFKPTTNAASLDIRLYDNHATTVTTFDDEYDFGDGVSIGDSSTDAVVDLKLTQDSEGDEPGYKQLSLSGRQPAHRGHPSRWVAYEFRGFQAEDRIVIYEIEIGGASKQ